MRPPTVERRFHGSEVRADESGKTLYGRAVKYGVTSELIYGYFTEELSPGCFDESLKSGIDVFCTIDHDQQRFLGRLSSKTLKLLPGKDGIDVECSLGDFDYGRNLVSSIQRKDLRGMSFIFDVMDAVEEVREGKPHRIVKKADLYEVAFVFFPAYPQTEAAVRMAFPFEGEKRALERMKALANGDWLEELARRRRRLRLSESF